MKTKIILISVPIAVVIGVGGYLLYRTYLAGDTRSRIVFDFLRDPESKRELVIPALTRCGDAPFVMPTTGMIGFIWDDSFRPGHHHQGIDIFSGENAGITPVFAAYDGYLSRLEDWKSTLIIRIPADPLQSNRQIWIYYTHMAEPSGEPLIVEEFPPGTKEVFVTTGTLLGYQGNYSGTPGNPTGVHLHFSVVKDDGQGRFLNELDIHNTLDPSPYFGMALNSKDNPGHIPTCLEP